MQTFLPYQSFVKSAMCLDFRRLGKQRIEASMILDILQGKESRWSNHPAVRMWKGYEGSLAWYHDIIIAEWISRGYNNNMPYRDGFPCDYPKWLDEEFCASHRSNLLRKDPEYYGQFGWKEPYNLSYIWPV